METAPIEFEDQDEIWLPNGVYNEQLHLQLRIALIEAQFSALRTYKPYLNASIEYALNFLFGPGEANSTDDAELKMWRKSLLTKPSEVEKRAKKAGPATIVSVPLKCVVIYDYLLPWILEDYKQNAPNEYAFICSGYVVGGVVTLTDYYPGEMKYTSPVACRLDEEFARDVVYDQIPPTHNIICWSHVHPIENPSRTDMEAFDIHAAWDEEVLENGLIQKRSLGMIISGHTHKISIFDTHDYSRPLKHYVIAHKGKIGKGAK